MNEWPADPRTDALLRRLVDDELAEARNEPVQLLPVRAPGRTAGRVSASNRVRATGAGVVVVAVIVAALALRGAITGRGTAHGGADASGASPLASTSAGVSGTPEAIDSGSPREPGLEPSPTAARSPMVLRSRAPSGTFTPIGDMDNSYAQAVGLADGRVLFLYAQAVQDASQIGTAEIYDPATGAFSATGSFITNGMPVAVRLADGRVLLAAGGDGTVQLFDPATGKFSRAGIENSLRSSTTPILLRSGKVLFAGGASGETTLASAELFDPATGTFEPTGSLSAPRFQPKVVLLADGRVLVAGGMSGVGNTVLASAEIYDPAKGTFSQTGSMVVPRLSPTIALLANGAVLVTGGVDADTRELDSAELYDPATGRFTSTGSMATHRLDHGATLLPNGRVLITGGIVSDGGGCAISGSSVLADVRKAEPLPTERLGASCGEWDATAELYDPASGQFTAAGTMTQPRAGHTAVLLQDGTVLIAGGENFNEKVVPSAEIYTP